MASVRINQEFRQADPSTRRTTLKTSGGSLVMRNLTMRRIIAWAYHIQLPQVAGPPWIDSERYDILAKTGRPASDDEMRSMLQTLLAERFNVRSHREIRNVQVMAFTLPKGGHKMTPSTKLEPQSRHDPVRGSVVEGVVLSELAENMARETNGIPVLDMTRLQGRFDFTFNVEKYQTSIRSQAATQPRITEPEMRLAFYEELISGELGLKLELRKAPVEFLVIDRADRQPAEN